jgi:ribosomal protein S18 acetylase RimI-like enzyme
MLSPDSIKIVLGAFNADDLVGIAGLRREPFRKTRHKATLWGVYCKPRVRNHGIAKQLVKEILSIAYNIPELTLVKLAVLTENVAAKKLYESFGFVSYGIEPNSMTVDKRSYDENLMVLNIEK